MWFQRLGFHNTLTLPATLDSKLMDAVKHTLGNSMAPLGFKTLTLEDGGFSIKQDLVKSNIGGERPCSRVPCMTCSTKPGTCWKSNCCYRMVCNRSPCTSTNTTNNIKVPTYIGETSHTTYSRGALHMALYRGAPREKEKSFMWRHCVDMHGGAMGPDRGASDFTMEVTATFKDAFTRIIDEAVGVKDAEDDPNIHCLNTRGEYYQPQFTRVAYTRGTRT